MLDDAATYIILAFALMTLYVSHRYIGDGLYILTKYWREAIFLVICALAGALVAVKTETIAHQGLAVVSGYDAYDETNVAITIDHCKQFVEARLEGRPYEELTPVGGRALLVNAKGNWKICAKAFGQNYWKHDISINGQNGGNLLCAAYAREEEQSGDVITWCNTVFSSPDQKI